MLVKLGASVAEQVAQVMGLEVTTDDRQVARLICHGGHRRLCNEQNMSV